MIIRRGNEILLEVTLIEMRSDRVRLGFDAAKDIAINRQEIDDAIQAERAKG